MPVLRFRIIDRGGPRVMAKHLRAACKAGYEAGLDDWHEHTLPKHFTRAGADEYGYEKRTKAHMKRKARKYGHQNPLMFSGDMKRMLQQMARITSTSRGGAVTMDAPRYVYYGQKLREITAVSRADEDRMAEVAEKVIAEKLDNATEV